MSWEVIGHFVDIGGIVDHYCLNFLFIIYLIMFDHQICVTMGNISTKITYPDAYSHRQNVIYKDFNRTSTMDTILY
jgi:hypothetical protein